MMMMGQRGRQMDGRTESGRRKQTETLMNMDASDMNARLGTSACACGAFEHIILLALQFFQPGNV